jgi:alpha-L-fucosidase
MNQATLEQNGLAPEESLDRFRAWRFGLFVHWGIYSVAGRHEWVQSRERLGAEQYRPYLEHFVPDLYDPAAWAREAWNAGMRYAVLTSKHHDGFCLWDTDETDYSAPRSAAGLDVVRSFLGAFRDRGLGVGLYHSLLDWHHPEFPIDGHHPQRSDPEPAAGSRDVTRYAAYLHAQVRELLTRYGDIDVMWFDFSYAHDKLDGRPIAGGKGSVEWQAERLLRTVRQLQPHILVNDRLGIPGDFITPEQYQPAGPMTAGGRRVLWEGCQTLNGSWGYDRDNLDWKPVEMLVKQLVDTVSKDGNLLLNVGPNARGEFDPRSLATLRGIGEWMRLHARAIHGAGPADFVPPPDCRYTRRGNRLYLHVFSWPFGHVHLPGLAGLVDYAQFMHDGSEVERVSYDPDQVGYGVYMKPPTPETLTLRLPIQRPGVVVPVIELFLTDVAG